jgi:nucleoid-associated protein YgaU
MTTDAKLGLAIGIVLVVAVAVFFFRKDLVPGDGTGEQSPASVGNPPANPSRAQPRRLAARAVSRTTARREHTVVEGDTLYGLAEHYYGDGERFIDLYDANRDVLKRPDQLEVGTVLSIPDP